MASWGDAVRVWGWPGANVLKQGCTLFCLLRYFKVSDIMALNKLTKGQLMSETSRSIAINELHNTVTSSAILIAAKLFNHDTESKETAKLFRDLVLRRIQKKDYRGADSGLIYFYTKAHNLCFLKN